MSDLTFSEADLVSVLPKIDGKTATEIIEAAVKVSQPAMAPFIKATIEASFELFLDKIMDRLATQNIYGASSQAGLSSASEHVRDDDLQRSLVVLSTVTLVGGEEYSLKVPPGTAKMLLGLKSPRSLIKDLLTYIYDHDYKVIGLFFRSLQGNTVEKYPAAKLLPEEIEQAILVYLKETWLPTVKKDTTWSDPVAGVMKGYIGTVLGNIREQAKEQGLIQELSVSPQDQAKLGKRRRKNASPGSSADASSDSAENSSSSGSQE